MSKRHTIEEGQSTESVAYDYGMFWETVWDHPENADLRSLRRDPNILAEGDTLYVPDKRPKSTVGATGLRHRFRRKGVPSRIEVRVLDADKPRAGVAYRVTIGKRVITGNADSDGWIRFRVMPDVSDGVLTLESGEAYHFEIGAVRPMATMKGVQARLRNLGYFSGEIDGEISEALRTAIRRFQVDQGLAPTGDPDSEFRAKLLDLHGS